MTTFGLICKQLLISTSEDFRLKWYLVKNVYLASFCDIGATVNLFCEATCTFTQSIEGSKFAYIKSVHLHQYTKDEIAQFCILVRIIQ